MSKYMFIVNPASANGNTKEKWREYLPQIEKALGKIDYKMTEAPKHAIELTRKALADGFKTIIAVGGDGTMNEVANGFFNHDGTPVSTDARLAVFSQGTGCDYIKTLEHQKGLEDVLEVLLRNEEKVLDSGWVIASDTEKERRFFLNIADSGIGGATSLRVNQNSKVLKGFISFMISALFTLLTYKDKKAKVYLDGELIVDGLINSVIVANGRYFGGGMKVAPEALMDDGILDVVIFHHMTRPVLLKSFPAIYKGDHIKNPHCSFHRGKHIMVETQGVENDMITELDGEQIGFTSAEFGIIPAGIKVLV